MSAIAQKNLEFDIPNELCLKTMIAQVVARQLDEIHDYEQYQKALNLPTSKAYPRSRVSRIAEKSFLVAMTCAESIALTLEESHSLEEASHTSETTVKALERLGEILLVFKPVLAVIQLGFDLKVAIKTGKFSPITKAFLSGLILVGTTITAAAVLTGAEVFLKPLFFIQLATSLVFLVRSILNVCVAYKNKKENKKKLDRNIKGYDDPSGNHHNGLVDYAKTLKEMADLDVTIDNIKKMQSHDNTNYLHMSSKLDNLNQKKEALASTSQYKDAVKNFDSLMQERLALEIERKKFKKRYNEGVKDIFYSVANIAAACLGSWISYFGLAVAAMTTAVISLDYARTLAKDRAEKAEMSTLEGRVEKYKELLDRSIQSKESKGWKFYFRWMSFGTRRAALSEDDGQAIKTALALRSKEMTEAASIRANLTDHTVFKSLVEPHPQDKLLANASNPRDRLAYLRETYKGQEYLQKPARWDEGFQGFPTSK